MPASELWLLQGSAGSEFSERSQVGVVESRTSAAPFSWPSAEALLRRIEQERARPRPEPPESLAPGVREVERVQYEPFSEKGTPLGESLLCHFTEGQTYRLHQANPRLFMDLVPARFQEETQAELDRIRAAI